MPRIHSGIAGLGSRDVRPGHFIAAAKNLYERGKRDFVLGVEHELALPLQLDPDVRPPGAFSMRGYSVGGFGSVATNKVIATVISNLFDLHVQAYPFYGSEKKGLPTRYFLTVADQPIRKHCELHHVEFVPLSALASFNLGNPLEGIAKGGTVFVQTGRTDPDEVWRQVPAYARRLIRDLDLRLLYADAAGIAAEVSTREDLRVRMQGIVLLGVFLRAAPFVAERRMGRDELMDAVRESLAKYFGKAGEKVVEENLICVQRGYDEVREVPPDVMQEEETEGRRAILGKQRVGPDDGGRRHLQAGHPARRGSRSPLGEADLLRRRRRWRGGDGRPALHHRPGACAIALAADGPRACRSCCPST